MLKENELREVLSKDLPESELINNRVEEAYATIRSSKQKKRKNLRWMKTAAAATVVITAGTIFCTANPTMAAKLPLVGWIFSAVEEDVSYKGDYSSHAEVITDEASNPYIQESNGIRVQVSEAYYSGVAIYLGISIEMEEEFPQGVIQMTDFGDYHILNMESTAVLDMSEAGLGRVTFAQDADISAPYNIEGKFIDNKTFAGIVRIDRADLQAETVPEAFTYEWNISDFWSNTPESTPDEYIDPETGERFAIEKYKEQHYTGSWNFKLNLNQDTANVKTIDVNQFDASGLGIASITKSKYEISIDYTIPNGTNTYDYIAAICDASGKRLDLQGSNTETFSSYNRDTSKVTVFIFDYLTYMDEYKTLDAEDLTKGCLYQTEVTLD